MANNQKSNPAFTTLLSDLVEDVLRYSDNPGACTDYITAHIRELIGVRIVALMERISDESGIGYRLVGICPPRMETYWHKPEVRDFINIAAEYDTPRLIDPTTDSAGKSLSTIGIGKSFVIPLLVGAERVGMLVLLDLMDVKGASIIFETLSKISSILALILRYSFLYRNLEHTVKIRTAQLARSEQLFRALFEQASDGILFLDIAGRIIAVNESFTRLHGYAMEEMLQLGIERLDVEGTAHVFDRIRRVMAGETLTFEVEHFHRDGHIFPLEVTANLISVGDEQLIIAIHRDITERKRAEKEQKERNTFIETIMENAPIGFAVNTIHDGQPVFVSGRFESIYGVPHDSIHSVDEFFEKVYLDPVFREQIRARIMTDMASGDASRMRWEDIPITTHTGEHKIVTAMNIPLLEQDLMISTVQDVTQRWRADESRRKSEALYHDLVETSHDLIWQCDAEGRYTYLNPAWEEVFGYTVEEMLGNRFSDFQTPEIAARDLREFARLMQGDSVKGFETVHIGKAGNEIRLVFNAKFLADENGKIAGTRGTAYDITDRKRADEERLRLQDQLLRAQKMEALGTLAGGVAHDLNNVLGVLSGYSELLLEEIPEGSRSRGHVEKILQSTEKGAAIIQDLLTLARRGVMASDVVNLNGVVVGFLKTPVFENIKNHHSRVTFRTVYDKELPNIKGSAIHMEKTVMNLVSNAAEAIPGQGEVTIRTENRYLDKPLRSYDEVKEGDYVVLTVSDTGMGIPAENREKIFEPFYTKKTMGRSGTGLGLAIVWGTVKDHNGYIDVQTEVGKGTTFTLYFPVTKEELIAPQQKEPIERFMGKGESVLVVDDIADQRDIAAGLLTRLGYNVRVASSGEEAIAYLKANKADILILDMIMATGIDGLETYQRVLEIHPKQKAIIVSGFSETDRVKEAQKLGAGAYVKKPYVLEKIGVAIREELRRTR